MGNRTPRVLFLHGVLSGHATWGALQRELGHDAVSLAPDLLGNGRALRPTRPYELDAIVDHLEPIVDRFDPTHVVGHSMGAIVALALRARMPWRFASTGLVGLPVYRDPDEALEFLGARGWLIRHILNHHGRWHLVCRAGAKVTHGWPWVMHRMYPVLPHDVLVATVDHCAAAHGPALNGIVFAGKVPGLAEVAGTPVMAIHGRRDRAAPIATARATAMGMGWTFTELEDANHQVVIEHPAVVAEWIRVAVLGEKIATPGSRAGAG
jgi:pimeloyl-ACP methyl ester carboxylesterase